MNSYETSSRNNTIHMVRYNHASTSKDPIFARPKFFNKLSEYIKLPERE